MGLCMPDGSLFYWWCQRTVGRRSAGGVFFNHLVCVLVYWCHCVPVSLFAWGLFVLLFVSTDGRTVGRRAGFFLITWSGVFVYRYLCVNVSLFAWGLFVLLMVSTLWTFTRLSLIPETMSPLKLRPKLRTQSILDVSETADIPDVGEERLDKCSNYTTFNICTIEGWCIVNPKIHKVLCIKQLQKYFEPTYMSYNATWSVAK